MLCHWPLTSGRCQVLWSPRELFTQVFSKSALAFQHPVNWQHHQGYSKPLQSSNSLDATGGMSPRGWIQSAPARHAFGQRLVISHPGPRAGTVASQQHGHSLQPYWRQPVADVLHFARVASALSCRCSRPLVCPMRGIWCGCIWGKVLSAVKNQKHRQQAARLVYSMLQPVRQQLR